MSVPDHRPMDEAEARALQRVLPIVHQWLNGHPDWPNPVLVIPIPERRNRGPLFGTMVLQRAAYHAPAPWAIREYRYIWWAAMHGDEVVAEGEPWRWFNPRDEIAGAPIPPHEDRIR